MVLEMVLMLSEMSSKILKMVPIFFEMVDDRLNRHVKGDWASEFCSTEIGVD